MFRPCIDLHQGKVKQIVGASLTSALKTNFIAEKPSQWFAELYRKDKLKGGHIIMLGGGNESSALAALSAYPGGLQIGGGIHLENAIRFLESGASHIIVTSWLFDHGEFNLDKLQILSRLVGKHRLVIDLSCRQKSGKYFVVTKRWQSMSSLVINAKTLEKLSDHCDEFLIHAVDVEGLCRGIDLSLVHLLSEISPIPTTYAGGAKSIEDLTKVTSIGKGMIDLSIGSALDLFGGNGIRYSDAVKFNNMQNIKYKK